MQLQETILFKTSCITTYIEWPHQDDLLKEVENIRNIYSNTRVQKSNVGGFQTVDFKIYDNRFVRILFENFIKPAAKEVGKLWNIPCNMNNVSYWYNINPKNTFNREHIHAGAFLSGVFYLQVPTDSGRIVFVRSVNEYDRMHHIQKEFANNHLKIDNPEVNTEHWIYPFPGLLLLFPGHLSHYVEQNNTQEHKDERISISFNF
jgi:uncharacterized protein (TIGR02466 family)